MKRNILMLTMALIGLVSFNQAQAQTMVAGGIDSVAVGSQVIYEVTPDANIATMVSGGILDASQFDWQIVSGTGTINTTTNGGTVDLYPSIINLTWSAEGAAEVSVAENSVRADAIVCADASPSTMEVVVLPLPTFTTDGGDAGGCGSQDYNVPLTLTGYGPWTVDYQIEYRDIDGNLVSTDTNQKMIGDSGDNVGTSSTTVNLPIVGATELNSGAGTYDITITSVDDRITLKDQNATTVDAALASGGSSAYTLYVFPTPETGTIQHISNE